MASLPISQLIELLGLTDDDVFIVNDTSVDPPETKRIKAITLLSAVVSSKWHAEPTIPSSADGDDDDFWTHTTTGDLYEKQTDGSWAKIGNLRGPKGLPGEDGAPATPGSVWYAEARDPIDSEGRDSDFHLNTASGDVFQKGGGAWGTPLLNLKRFEGPAEKVTYVNAAYPAVSNVKDALDELLYFPPSATLTITVAGGTTHEIGSAVDEVTLSWSFNKDVSGVTLTDFGPVVTPGMHTFTGLGLTTNKSWTITGSDGKQSASATRSVLFQHQRYWGTSPETSLDSADILALSNEFATGRAQSRTMDGNGQYIYFAYPKSWGQASFKVNGLDNTAWTESEVAFTNASGHTETFYVYWSNTLQNGSGLSIEVL